MRPPGPRAARRNRYGDLLEVLAIVVEPAAERCNGHAERGARVLADEGLDGLPVRSAKHSAMTLRKAA
jgi:hypothetical protein